MANVPQFGDWENNGNVPYTEFFDKARKGKGGVKSQETPVENSSSDGMQSRGQPKVLDEQRPTDAPPNHGDREQRYVSDSSMQSRDRTGSADPQRRTTRGSAGSDRSMDNVPANSPLHGKAAERPGSASPYRGQGFAGSTPGRSKLRQHDEVQEKGTAVPKFGEWDEKDPAAGDNYTEVFGRLKNERHGENPSDTNRPGTANTRDRAGNAESSGCSCFSWFKSGNT